MHSKEIAMCYATEDAVSIFKGHMGVGCINRGQAGIRQVWAMPHRHPQKSITTKVGVCTGWTVPSTVPSIPQLWAACPTGPCPSWLDMFHSQLSQSKLQLPWIAPLFQTWDWVSERKLVLSFPCTLPATRWRAASKRSPVPPSPRLCLGMGTVPTVRRTVRPRTRSSEILDAT